MLYPTDIFFNKKFGTPSTRMKAVNKVKDYVNPVPIIEGIMLSSSPVRLR